MNSENEIFMQRCFDLALCGSGNTAPNPLVGAVVVYQSKIIGEGYHEKFGAPHAEVNAINSIVNKSLLPHSTLFVNLEPCCHYGKTPPCTQLIIKSGIKNVVISNPDPNPLVGGKGITELKKAGCKVQAEIFKEKGVWINRRFFTFHQKRRPYIILKWAQSNDGFFTKDDKRQHWITGKQSQRLVHRWRGEETALIVGTKTILVDNPQLTDRLWMKGNQPVRIVLDRKLRIPKTMNVFDSAANTIVFTEGKSKDKANIRYIQIDFKKDVLKSIMLHLCEMGILSIIVEGGTILLNEFIEQNLWDEARIFTGKANFDHGVAAPLVCGKVVSEDKIGNDQLRIITNI